MPFVDIRSFINHSQPIVIASNTCTHNVLRGTLSDEPSRVWIRKELNDPASARTEVLAQELFRLFIPHQPETRLATNPSLTTGVYYVLSEEVPAFRPLPENQSQNFANGVFTGLGQALFFAMFFQEVDLKNGNVGLDNRNRVIKIDGDWCFSSFNSEEENWGPFLLSPASIECLPCIKDFYTYNWLELTVNNVNYSTSIYVNPELSQEPQFRAEVNQAMLMACVLPDCIIERMVDAYLPAGGDRYMRLIINRREELRLSALQNSSFQAYLNIPEAHATIDGFVEQMKTFKFRGEPLTLAEEREDMQADVSGRDLTRPVIQCNTLLEAIHSYCQNAEDPLTEFVRTFRARIDLNTENTNELIAIKAELSVRFLNVLQTQCDELLRQIQQYSAVDDPSVATSILEEQAHFEANKSNPAELLSIKMRLCERRLSTLVTHCEAQMMRIQQCNTTVNVQALEKYFFVQRERIRVNRYNLVELLAIKEELFSYYHLNLQKSQCNAQLAEIQQHCMSGDKLLSEYIKNSQRRIREAVYDDELATIKMELTKVLASVSSPEVLAVKAVIKKMHGEALPLFFTIGKHAKASRIEHALFNTPIEERATVITQQGHSNQVQCALASHRLTWTTGYVYKNKQNDIDEKYAARTYSEIRKKFIREGPKTENGVNECIRRLFFN